MAKNPRFLVFKIKNKIPILGANDVDKLSAFTSYIPSPVHP